ncbi:MAG: hypothetical protein DSM106950_38175 [Stigonema ocellatum SAG 48.90 = DSM 106950]|nr:hypothetical protein [Stigonema ocellatum SAG 48.90 = DSM 106950]
MRNITIISIWKIQQMTSLPILIQFSTIPLVRKAIKTLIHYQLLIVGFVFIATLALVIREDAPRVILNKQVAIAFFSAVSQSLAALLGVLIIFLTFNTQLITQRRYEDYYKLQLQIDLLIRLTQSLPSEVNHFAQNLIGVIDYLVPLQLKDFFISTTSPQVLPLDKLLKNFKNKSSQVQQECSIATHLQLQQILLVINNIEEILERFSRLSNYILDMSRFIVAIAKLSFLLGISLVFLLLFGIVGVQSKFPDISLPIIVSLAIWVLIVLLELVLDTWFLYKNIHSSSSHFMRFFR